MALQFNYEVSPPWRVAMKKELHKDYAALCNSSTVEGSLELLFGNLSKLAKDISKANKLTKKVKKAVTLFTKLGFFIHPQKSVFVPTQQLTFLGFVLDSIGTTVTPTEAKIQKIKSSCDTLLKTPMPTIKQVAEVIGILVSNFPGAQYGPLHYRNVERDKYLALVFNKGNYEGKIQLSPMALQEIRWWLNNAITLHRDIQHPRPSVTIQSDASKLGWGAVLGAQKTGGRWTPLETESHINVLELLAAFFALKCYCSKMGNCHIQLQIDNTTAIVYITVKPGQAFPSLTN